MVESLEYLHSKGWCHKDVKPENFLLDFDFNVKLCDFGFSELKVGPHGDFKQMNFNGTAPYQTPEILRREPHDGESADLFALGVCLFAMIKAGQPFRTASDSDSWYELLRKGRAEEFWKRQSNVQTNPIKFSLEFMDLFTQMVAHDPKLRPSISKLKQHVWYTMAVPTQQEVISEMRQRVQMIHERKEAERMLAMQNEQVVQKKVEPTTNEEGIRKAPLAKKAAKPKGPGAEKERSSQADAAASSLEVGRPQQQLAFSLPATAVPPTFELFGEYSSHNYHYSILDYREIVQLLVRWFSLKAKSFEVILDEFKVLSDDQIIASLESWAGKPVGLEVRIFKLAAGTVVEFFHVEGPLHSCQAFEKQIKSTIDMFH